MLLYFTLSVSWWLTVPLAILGGGLMVRVFIIFHDCCHGSFFKGRRTNDILGFITGVLTFTSYHHWKWEHSAHHATSGDLDRRGIGDIWTLTVDEFLSSSAWRRFSYRLARHPLVLFIVGPVYLFLIQHRIPLKDAKPHARRGIWLTNLGVLAQAVLLISIFGLWPWLILQLTMIVVAGSAGVWLFYVQHQFEDAYWEHSDEWDYTDAALKGGSYYKLPRILQWFSGNIGFHHIHHLSPRIPNYHLESCHHSDSLFSQVKTLTIGESLKSLPLRLWDEESKRLISFKQLPRQH